MPEVRHFFSALERLSTDAARESSLLTGAAQLLQRSAREANHTAERRHAILDAVLNAPGNGRILVITRSTDSARQLRLAIAKYFDSSIEALTELGIDIQSFRASIADSSYVVAIAAGYFGRNMLDALLASGAATLHFVFDPIEARVAWFGIRRMAEFMRAVGIPSVTNMLEFLAAQLAPYAPAFSEAETNDVSLSLNFTEVVEQATERIWTWVPATEAVTIYLTDGTQLNVARNTRFELFAMLGRHIRLIRAAELQHGDQIVLLNDDTHTLSSEQLMDTLDKGSLRADAEQRSAWLAIVHSVYDQHRPNLRAVARRMAELGERIDYASVRSWVTFSDPSLASVPEQWQTFLAFAEAFGIHLPREDLLDLFRSIRRWRIRHRRAGRDLARAIRAAYVNRVDAPTLARIEREWGLNPRRLLQAARLATVDEVVLPNEVSNADKTC
jgi:hypothetical protein